jgi:hypothetical protein
MNRALLLLLLLSGSAHAAEREASLTTLPAGESSARLRIGFTPSLSSREPASWLLGGEVTLNLFLGLTDRLQLMLFTPAVSYRLGESGAREGVGWAGFTGWGLRPSLDVAGSLGLGTGAGIRQWTGSSLSLIALADARSELAFHDGRAHGPRRWMGQWSAGFAWNATERLTFALGARWNQLLSAGGGVGPLTPLEQRDGGQLTFGSVQHLGLRALPLVQVHLPRGVSLDGYASLGWNTRTGALTDRYLIGLSLHPE